ncbi:MAG: calcium-binding protein [Microscillaceae bacterium]|nr:calcium-binding protein [Microscillaceae bacterium]
MSDNISFPFTAKLKVQDRDGNEVLVSVEAVSFDDKNSFRVKVSESGASHLFSESLLKLKEIKADFYTKQAINDWKYWRAQGNSFF